MNLNSKHTYDYYGYRVGDTRCRNGKCCNLISVGCIQWDFPSTELYNKKETLEEILRKIEELLLKDNNNFPISNVGGGYELYAGVHNEENTFRTLTAADGIIITQNAETIQIGFDTSSIPPQGTSIHNDLTGIQGGSPNEYYHFNEIQHKKLLDLIYVNNDSTISVSPSSGERGVNTALTVNYNITPNDDVFGTAYIDQGIGDVTDDIDAGNQSASGGNSTINKSFTMDLNYTRNGEPQTENKTATYNTYIPQWAGWSSEDDFSTYSEITTETNLQKFIQSSASINKATSPTNQYIWFISNKNNATIKDTNDFVQTVGIWGNVESEFYTKPLLLTLADGVTTATVHLYRSRDTKNLTSFTYKIS